MKTINPLHGDKRKDVLDYRQEFGQLPLPWKVVTGKFDPTFNLCDGKILRYEPKQLAIWRALVSTSSTILTDWDTWNHLTILTVICFITTFLVWISGSEQSIEDTNSVVNRIQVLISFIFASYVTIIINRWDRARNTYAGQVWGALENLNLSAYQILFTHSPKFQIVDGKVVSSGSESESNSTVAEHVELLKDYILRISRLDFQLLFLAMQGEANMDKLVEKSLLTDKEKVCLDGCTVGTRPLVVMSWFTAYFDELKKKYGYKIGDVDENLIQSNISSLRGGIGGTLGSINTQLPYPYVHIVYWTIQILLLALSIETGVSLGVMMYSKENGNGEYSPNDDTVDWPQNPYIWYMNKFFQITASNVIFALFAEGMLKICDKLSNPFSKDDTSFSETFFDWALHNNCRAMRVGMQSYPDVIDLTSPIK